MRLLPLCVAGVLTACGGGGGSAPSTTAPSIVAQPQNVSVSDGQSVTFSVAAAGTAPLTYQWQKNSANISGATASSYTTVVQLTDSGSQFTVVVTNAAASVASAAATLTVKAVTPTITTQPANQAVSIGATATFTVVASAGSSTLHYQWMKNGTNVGNDGPSYTTASATASDSGSSYTVIVNNTAQGGGAVTSNAASLAVLNTLALLAGELGGVGDNNATGVAATFYGPAAVAVDSSGNIYVADETNQLIRKITPAGVVSNFAGTVVVPGSADGTGAAASFDGPSGVAVDTAGNVYVADSNNDTIRKITPAGVVSTLAGSAGVAGSADGTGAAASFNGPSGVAVDTAGNVYVADTNNDTIRKITPVGVVTTLAGSPGVSGSTDSPTGPGSLARFYLPQALAVDSLTGNIYVADSLNSTIRKITSAGVVTTLAGTAGSFGSSDGTGAAASFNGPTGIALDSTAANLYVADASNNTIRQVTTSAGVVTTVAGTAGTSGSGDGTGTGAQFDYPTGVATNPTNGNVIVADANNNLIRSVTTVGATTTLAGNIGGRGYADGTGGMGGTARFYDPHNIALDAAGNIFVADLSNNVIRKITVGGVVSTFAGSVGPGGVGSANGTGSAAQFNAPFGMTIDSHGNLFVADSKNNTIRKITPAGTVSTFAGTAGVTGSANGIGPAAQFNNPLGLAIDAADNLYVADDGNETIRMITPSGVVTTLAGTPGVIGSADGTGPAASFWGAHGVAVNLSTSNVYVADRFNGTIRMITPSGIVTTVAGTPGLNDFADGTGSAAHFNWPGALAVDNATGDLYVTDYNHNAVRKITPGSVVTTVVGNLPGAQPSDGAMLGVLPGALSGPSSIAVVPGAALELAISDSTENSILLATLP